MSLAKELKKEEFIAAQHYENGLNTRYPGTPDFPEVPTLLPDFTRAVSQDIINKLPFPLSGFQPQVSLHLTLDQDQFPGAPTGQFNGNFAQPRIDVFANFDETVGRANGSLSFARQYPESQINPPASPDTPDNTVFAYGRLRGQFKRTFPHSTNAAFYKRDRPDPLDYTPVQRPIGIPNVIENAFLTDVCLPIMESDPYLQKGLKTRLKDTLPHELCHMFTSGKDPISFTDEEWAEIQKITEQVNDKYRDRDEWIINNEHKAGNIQPSSFGVWYNQLQNQLALARIDNPELRKKAQMYSRVKGLNENFSRAFSKSQYITDLYFSAWGYLANPLFSFPPEDQSVENLTARLRQRGLDKIEQVYDEELAKTLARP